MKTKKVIKDDDIEINIVNTNDTKKRAGIATHVTIVLVALIWAFAAVTVAYSNNILKEMPFCIDTTME